MKILRTKESLRCASHFSFLAVVLIALILPTLAMGQTFVQGATDEPAPTKAASVAVPFSTAQASGDLNVIIVGWSNNSSTVTSVADSAGNTYKLAVGTQTTPGSVNAVSQAIYYAPNIAAALANTVTVTFNQSTDFPDVRILEYNGADTTSPLDVVAGATGGTSPASSGTVTTTTASDIVVGGGTTSGAFTNSNPPANFTSRVFNSFTDDIAGDTGPVTPGSVSLSDTVSGNWVLQLAAFGSTPRTALPAPTLAVAPVSPTSVSDTGGDSVTITGTNFAPGATVLFGTISGVNCSLTSSTSIQCAAPAHAAGAVDITVTNVDGQSAATSGAPFSFIVVITPSISTIAPATGPTNGGTAITVSGTNFVGPATVVIGGQPASNVTVSNGGTQITANAPAGAAGAATLGVINSDGSHTSQASAFTYQASPGVSFVQVASATSSVATTTVPIAYPLPQAAGDLNVVVVGWNNTTADIQSVTDSAGNPYTLVASSGVTKGNNLSQAVYYAKNIQASASNTITVKFTASADFPDVRVAEYSGIDVANPLDNAAGGFGTGATADSGALTTTNASDLIVGAATVSSGITGPGAGYTTVALTPVFNDNVEHQIVSVSGTYHATASLASGNWVMQAVAFKAAAAAPPPSFSLSASPSTQPVNAGSSATYTVTVTGQQGFTGTVSLAATCPANVGIACSISPNAVAPGSASDRATLTVTTTGRTAVLLMPQGKKMLPLYALWLPLPGIALAGVGLGSRRRKLGIGLDCLVVIGLTLLLAGCGGGGSSSSGGGGGGGTPAGSYTITVTGMSSGVASQTSTVTLTVQ